MEAVGRHEHVRVSPPNQALDSLDWLGALVDVAVRPSVTQDLQNLVPVLAVGQVKFACGIARAPVDAVVALRHQPRIRLAEITPVVDDPPLAARFVLKHDREAEVGVDVGVDVDGLGDQLWVADPPGHVVHAVQRLIVEKQYSRHSDAARS